MAQAHLFSHPPEVSFSEAFSRAHQELALRQALRYLPTKRTPGPVSYPLGLALGIFAAHMGHVIGQITALGIPAWLVAFLTTVAMVAATLMLWRRRDRWVLYLATIGAGAGLFLAPRIVDVEAIQFLLRTCTAVGMAGPLPG